MKKHFIILLFFTFLIGQIFAQTDKYGNPVFNSISMKEIEKDNWVLSANYYTLKNNIENPLSAVYISDAPTLDQIEEAAIQLSSDFYLLIKDRKLLATIVLLPQSHDSIAVLTMNNQRQYMFPSGLTGDITENRANEIIKEGYEPNASIKRNQLNFNRKKFQIITNKEIENAIVTLIENQGLHELAPSEVTILSQEEIKNIILEESKDGGDFDFFTEIKGEENEGIQIKSGVYATKLEMALYQWGRVCFEMGVNKPEDAFDIYSEFKGEVISEKEKRDIKRGFFKELEK